MSADDRFRGLSRRTFLDHAIKGAALGAAAPWLAACEGLIVAPRDEPVFFPFATPDTEETWFYQSGQGTSKRDAPRISREDWSAEVTVEGRGSETWTFGSLSGFDLGPITIWKTLRGFIIPVLVGTPQTLFVANGAFTGVPLASALRSLNPPASIQRVRFTAADGFTTNIPMSRVMDASKPLILLATELNGEPLSRLRGGPVRLIVPEAASHKNMKWLSRIDLVTSDAPFGRYEEVLFAPNGVGQAAHEHVDRSSAMPLQTLVFDPATNSTEHIITSPEVIISGVAFSVTSRVTRMEVSVDDGPYEAFPIRSRSSVLGDEPLDARTQQGLGAYPYAGVWTPWTHRLRGLSSGVHTVRVRATSADGVVQREVEPEDIFTRVAVAMPPAEVTFTFEPGQREGER